MTPQNSNSDPLRPGTLAKAWSLIQRLARQLRTTGQNPAVDVSPSDERAMFQGTSVASPAEVDQLRAALAGERAAHAATRSALAAAQQARPDIVATLAACDVKIDAGAADLPAEVTRAIREKVDAAAAERLAESGVPVSALPRCSPSDHDDEDELESLRAQVSRESDPVKAGKLAARLVALRDQRQRG